MFSEPPVPWATISCHLSPPHWSGSTGATFSSSLLTSLLLPLLPRPSLFLPFLSPRLWCHWPAMAKLWWDWGVSHIMSCCYTSLIISNWFTGKALLQVNSLPASLMWLVETGFACPEYFQCSLSNSALIFLCKTDQSLWLCQSQCHWTFTQDNSTPFPRTWVSGEMTHRGKEGGSKPLLYIFSFVSKGEGLITPVTEFLELPWYCAWLIFNSPFNLMS